MAERPQVILGFWGFLMVAVAAALGFVALVGSVVLTAFSARSMGQILVVVSLYQLVFRLLPRVVMGQDFEWWNDFTLLLFAAPLAVLFLALAQMQRTLNAIRDSLDGQVRAGGAGIVIEPMTIDAVAINRPHSG